MKTAPRPRLFARPARRGWFPLMLPLGAVLAVVSILWRSAQPQLELPFTLHTHLGAPASAPEVASASQGLLDQAVTVSGLLDPIPLSSWSETGVWLALPGAPFMVRWLEPELRAVLSLPGKLGGGSPFMLPGTLLIQQAGTAAEALLRRRPPPTHLVQAKG